MSRALVNSHNFKPTRLTCMGVCFDIEGNTVDCGSSDNVGYSPGAVAGDSGSGLTLTSSNNPIAASAGASNGTTALSGVFSSLLNFGTTITKAVTQPTAASNLRLQVNPATGLQQYYNPSTNQYVGAPIQPIGGGLIGNNSMLLIVIAIIVGFFAFGGLKKAAA